MSGVQPGVSPFRRPRARQRWNWENPPWWALLVILPFLLGLALTIRESRTDNAIAAREQSTTATIIGHQPSNHDSYQYAFLIGARSYSGSDTPPNREYRLGERATVYYDPQDPSANGFRNFGEISQGDLGPILFMLWGSIGVIGYVVVQRWRHRAR